MPRVPRRGGSSELQPELIRPSLDSKLFHMSKRRLILIFGAVIFAIYLALPFIAGSKSWGDRDGPVIYPEGFHSSAYIIGAEESGLPKPRRSMTSILSNRPLFYGLRRRPNRVLKNSATCRFEGIVE